MPNVHLAVRGKTTVRWTACGRGVKRKLKAMAWGRFRAATRDAIQRGIDPADKMPRPMTSWDID